MGMLWIEADDEGGSAWSARWGSVTNEQADQITAFIESVVGPPDTVC